MILCGRSVSSRYQDDVPALLNLFKGHCFFESSLDLVPHHRVPNALPHRKSKPTNFQAIAPRGKHQQTVGPASSFTPHCRKVLRLPEALVFTHQSLGANTRASGSNRESLPPFEHAPLQNIAPILGAHPRSESVHSRSTSLTWLIGSFWHLVVSILIHH